MDSRFKPFTILKRMDQLIHLESTGTPAEFAHKLEISERSQYNYLKILEDLGADIQFNTHRISYEFKNKKRLVIKIGYK